MAYDQTALFARLDDLGIAHRTVAHPPIMTVDEGRAFKASMPGGHSKNLFVKDKKGQVFLITAHSDTDIDLVSVGKSIGARGRLSFANAELMRAMLEVEPGSVTPFAVGASGARDLAGVILDAALFDHDPVWFHPLANTASTAVAADDLVAYIRACGHEPRVMTLSTKTGPDVPTG